MITVFSENVKAQIDYTVIAKYTKLSVERIKHLAKRNNLICPYSRKLFLIETLILIHLETN